MTKRQLLEYLEPFTDDQWVVVLLHSDDFPNGSQVIIQGVKTFPPWHPEPDSLNLVGLVAHARNREMPIWRKQTGKDDPTDEQFKRFEAAWIARFKGHQDGEILVVEGGEA